LQGYAQEAAFGVRNKKPFCNAFTGCGGKRSDPDVAEGELLGLMAEKIQGIRDQVTSSLTKSFYHPIPIGKLSLPSKNNNKYSKTNF
jgi:hypothetical protein